MALKFSLKGIRIAGYDVSRLPMWTLTQCDHSNECLPNDYSACAVQLTADGGSCRGNQEKALEAHGPLSLSTAPRVRDECADKKVA